MKLSQNLIDKFNQASERNDLNEMLGASFAFRELLVMEARNLDEQVCRPIHGKLMQSYLNDSRIITPENPGIVHP